MDERRGAIRHKSLLRGLIYVSPERGALACLIRDLSDKGARVIFSDNVPLPDVVDLHIPKRDQTLRAHVQWRRNDELGLAFIESERAPVADPAAGEPAPAEVPGRIAMLEAEIASLHELLKRLKRKQARTDDETAA